MLKYSAREHPDRHPERSVLPHDPKILVCDCLEIWVGDGFSAQAKAIRATAAAAGYGCKVWLDLSCEPGGVRTYAEAVLWRDGVRQPPLHLFGDTLEELRGNVAGLTPVDAMDTATTTFGPKHRNRP